MATRAPTWLPPRLRSRRAVIVLQLTALAVLLGVLGWALQDVWADAVPRLRDADPVDFGIALVVIAVYYLVFVLGWIRILAAYGLRVPYRIALQSEMVSLLAKYIPGGVWTPAARTLALRRFGFRETHVVLATILLEAGLSAIAGIGVFVVALAFMDESREPVVPLVAFAGLLGVLLHPRVFRWLARRVLKPFGAQDLAPLPMRTALGLLAFYAFTWPLGGVALYFLLRSVGGDPAASSIPYLGGVAAVGAIVAVLVIFAPSGLGVREGSMYGLLLAVAAESVALGATVLNRLSITLVEIVLVLAGVFLLRRRRREAAEPEEAGPAGELVPQAR